MEKEIETKEILIKNKKILSIDEKFAKIAKAKQEEKEKSKARQKLFNQKLREIKNIEKKKKKKEKDKLYTQVGQICEKILGIELKEEYLLNIEKFLLQQEKNGNFYTKAVINDFNNVY